ncbi:MAG: tetratricopeptide repeat protein [Woeseiaceae bacterium]|nr:tetratricopeptide repeat protein [Woeseiaceae bacterium]
MSSKTSELDAKRWRRVADIFSRAVELEPAQRDDYLNSACSDDSTLLEYVRDLLRADATVETVVERTIVNTVRDAFVDDAAKPEQMKGQMIGPYRVERLLGSGGMGLVYLARRADEQFDQQVAIKLGRHRLVDPQTELRLRHERQFLADLDHPNIARLFDGGTTDDGVPYLVMEFIDGIRLDTYCDLHRLNVTQRLQLFQTICRAVHYAHQNLIIHRDIKATNILVAQDGTPKLLDFGIAKLSDAEGAATAGLTRDGAVIMTPANGAPEQISGKNITTATDVYGLGLLLYDLLSGLRAYETDGITPAEAARVIAEETAPAPSRKLARKKAAARDKKDAASLRELEQIASDRSTSLERLQRQLRGDLDVIVSKTLRKEPERRYRSANAIADDIGLHLRAMPIVARTDSWRYRTGKFVQRHFAAVGASVLVVAMLATFTVLLSVQNRTVIEERDTARAVIQFLEDIFMAHDPSRARGVEVTAEEILAEGATRIRNNLSDRPEIQSSLMGTIGRVYYNLGEYQPSEDMLEQALDLRIRTYGESHPAVAAARNDLAEVLIRRAQYGRATDLLKKSLAVNQLSNDGTSPLVATNLFNLANVHLATGNLDEAESAVRSSIAIFRQIRDEYSLDLAEAVGALARVLQVRGNLDETEALLLEAIDIINTSQGPDHPYMAYYLQNLGVLQRSKGDLDAAEQTLASAIDAIHRILGDKHDLLAVALVDQGRVLHMQGEYDEAERMIRQALELGIEIHGTTHPRLGLHKTILGMLLHDNSALRDAEQELREALQVFDQVLDDDHQYIASALTELGAVLNTSGRAEQGLELLETALRIRLKDYPREHMLVAATQVEYADALSRLGRFEEAEPLLREALMVLDDTANRRSRRAAEALARYEALSADSDVLR